MTFVTSKQATHPFFVERWPIPARSVWKSWLWQARCQNRRFDLSSSDCKHLCVPAAL